MLFLYLMACQQDMETGEEAISFLDTIVNMWWHLESIDDDFHLEQENPGELSGLLYIDYYNGPADTLEFNILEGTWHYDFNRRFHIEGDDDSYDLKISDVSDQPDCYRVKYKLYSDVACPL